ncbi:Protein of unknown function [Nocardia amikacinitolerans]|uniref:DUF3618 domain-containing protein n=1 Tax=Nocardia amikacinitolerans TaxID=756689 RepID=A0A285LZ89_9NOCA|nr:DUF3618 domain-containing protein [Nocardia amikacinitolerans]MCP2280229.1 Protein of unknown function (DUF3618) [Nocardia amikacinitolerans]MCP2299504.1 Protein of unknown function (DUF3618) [Nocardia amikacinitolerans]MCP2316903.1 Protein of unknown function (DUF3618) [Nocardia amikacinitolerans]SNY88621.1 Protein of unknown function [Nocardia amikacinitolerans]
MSDVGRPNIPNGSDALRKDRDQARRQLGETVAELTGKFDVPGRVEDKAHETADAARHRVADAKQHAHETADAARHRVAEATHHARDTAEQARAQVGHLVDRAAKAQEPVIHRGKQLVGAARMRPAPIAAAAVGAVVLFWWMRRRRA